MHVKSKSEIQYYFKCPPKVIVINLIYIGLVRWKLQNDERDQTRSKQMERQTSSWRERLNIVLKKKKFPKSISWFNTILIKISGRFSVNTDEIITKFIWKNTGTILS